MSPHHHKGWKLCVQWKDGSTSREPMADMKEASPLQAVKYAVTNQLDHKLAFAWWVGYTLQCTKWIIKAANNKCYHKRTHKFRIELPKMVCEALETDCCTRTTFWHNALKLEMKNARVAFDILKDEDDVPVGYQKINCYIVFNIKLGSLKHKC